MHCLGYAHAHAATSPSQFITLFQSVSQVSGRRVLNLGGHLHNAVLLQLPLPRYTSVMAAMALHFWPPQIKFCS